MPRLLWLTLISLVLLAGCISGAPPLTTDQTARLPTIALYPHGTPPPRAFDVMTSLIAADCSGPGGSRLFGQDRKAMEILARKAAALSMDAVVDVVCTDGPFVNNCWGARVCEGQAARWR